MKSTAPVVQEIPFQPVIYSLLLLNTENFLTIRRTCPRNHSSSLVIVRRQCRSSLPLAVSRTTKPLVSALARSLRLLSFELRSVFFVVPSRSYKLSFASFRISGYFWASTSWTAMTV